MKKILTAILIIVVVIGSYIITNIVTNKYQNTKNIEMEQKSGQKILTPEEEKEALFEKKKECASYKKEIMEDILTPNLVYKNSDPELEEIFYSPKRNSCLYIFDYYKSPSCMTVDNETYLKLGCQLKETQIVDFLTKETVYSSVNYDRCFKRALENENFDIANCKTVSEMVDELKE